MTELHDILNLVRASFRFRSHQPPSEVIPLDYARYVRIQSDVELLFSRGWCWHQLRSLMRTCGTNLFSHFASFDQLPIRQVDHRACDSASSCIAFNVDMKRYKSHHVNPMCTCASASISNEQLLTLIDQHEIPLVSIETQDSSTNDQLTLSLHKRKIGSSYTAISHVWIDGLGNPEANALPLCQLRQLAERLQNITGSSNTLFWLDTLCIPTRPERARQTSIAVMASIYAGAANVLVLDTELMKTPWLSFEASVSRILCSVWMYRCWTMQEALLAKRCLFQFADTVYATSPLNTFCSWKSINGALVEHARDMTIFVSRGPPTPLWLVSARVLHRLQSTTVFVNLESELARALKTQFLDKFFGTIRTRHEMHYRFAFAWTELCGRSTTHADDIFIILANLLSLDHRPLLLMPPEMRLPTIILSLKKIPLSIFSNTGARLDTNCQHNNKWMPTHIGQHFLESFNMVQVKKNRLQFMFNRRSGSVSVYLIKTGVPSNAELYVINVPSQNLLYQIRPMLDNIESFDLSGIGFTCLIIEETNRAMPRHLFEPAELLGSMFYVDKDHSHTSFFTRKSHLTATFYCPIRAIRRENTGFLPTFEGARLHSGHINIKYDSIPQFKPLQRYTDIGMYHDRKLSLIYPVVYMGFCSLAGIIWAFRGPEISSLSTWLDGLIRGAILIFPAILVVLFISRSAARFVLWAHVRTLMRYGRYNEPEDGTV